MQILLLTGRVWCCDKTQTCPPTAATAVVTTNATDMRFKCTPQDFANPARYGPVWEIPPNLPSIPLGGALALGAGSIIVLAVIVASVSCLWKRYWRNEPSSPTRYVLPPFEMTENRDPPPPYEIYGTAILELYEATTQTV